MIDIATWRARIGLHNASIGGSCGKTANVCRNVHLLHRCLLRLHGLLLSVLLALTTTTLGHVMMVITTLLLLAGDVELNPGPTLGMKPDLAALFCFKYMNLDDTTNKIYIIDTIASKWKLFGLNLGFPPSTLENIQTVSGDDVHGCAQRLLALWLQGHIQDTSRFPITWETLLEVLRDTDYEELARTLTNQLLKDDNNGYEVIFHKALRRGYVKMKITKMLLSGAGATGKSSLIALLLGKPPIIDHNSTLLSRPLRHARLTAGKDNLCDKWDCFDDPRQLLKLLADCMKDLPTVDQLKQSPSSEEPVSFLSSAHTSAKTSSHTFHETNTYREIVPIMERATKSNRLTEVHWIYTIDCGGQPAFLDTLPAFIRGNSVTVHTLKLNEPLDDPVKMVFSVELRHRECVLVNPPKNLCLTNLQLTKTLLRSASSTRYRFHESSEKATPKCLIVGTFKDKVTDCAKIVKEIDDRLRQFNEILIKTEGSLVYPVDTTVKEEKVREEVASKLRERITDSHGTSQEIKIPVRWFMFELELRKHADKNEQGILRMETCKKIGESFEMNEEEVKACVMYLHKQTLLFYFYRHLPDIVFLHAQSILDKVSAILFISYLPNTLTASDDVLSRLQEFIDKVDRKLPSGSFERLQQNGLFSEELVKALVDLKFPKLDIKFSDYFTPKNFLWLLEYLLVIARVSDDEYFMPCVLSTELPSKQQKKPFSYYIFLWWDDMPIPQGLFPSLVVHLLKRKKSPTFKLQPQSCTIQQHRNALTLSSESTGGGLLLVDSIEHIAVYYSGCISKCPLIREAIEEGLEAVVELFCYQLNPVNQGFVCRCASSRRHMCKFPTDSKDQLTCCNTSSVIKCTDQERCWFVTVSNKTGSTVAADLRAKNGARTNTPDSSTSYSTGGGHGTGVVNPSLHTEPSEKDLMNNVAAKIPAKWYEFGVQLNIPTGTLNAVRRHTALEYFIEVFSIWKRSLSREPISWVTVITVLESPSIDERKLAADLRAKYGADTNTPNLSTSSSSTSDDGFTGGANPSLHKPHVDRHDNSSCWCWWSIAVVILVIGVIWSFVMLNR